METAIVLPVILLLVFGIIDFGRALQQQTQLAAAVREGARVGALNGTAAAVQTKVSAVANSGGTLTYPTLTVCTGGSGLTDSTVTARQTFTPLTPVFAFMQLFGASGNLGSVTATGVMSCTG
ncbi:pilus assembly protein [Actinoplanes sp. LDG1-06]|uniref:Pilus assembly protein n=1 Tax=Paractinoplanes ovalisporus TaxID=2810368 RepID=A0ABS2AK69_9ACTN|nr:TadE/TadG family type IV pilus assembly protein [Actinoplanes ovalisporus]MBM2620249.1 pilus assembly protein [Actinoplanes ovalisporus]